MTSEGKRKTMARNAKTGKKRRMSAARRVRYNKYMREYMKKRRKHDAEFAAKRRAYSRAYYAKRVRAEEIPA